MRTYTCVVNDMVVVHVHTYILSVFFTPDYVAESLTDGHKTDTTQPPSTSHEVPTSEPPQSTSHEVPTSEPPQSTSHEVPTSEPPQSTSHKVPTSKSTKLPLPNSSQKEESETENSKLTLEGLRRTQYMYNDIIRAFYIHVHTVQYI